MNSVILIGRLTRDGDYQTTNSGMAIYKFNLAVERPVRAGEEKKADFPRVTVFGKMAESCDKYLARGRLVAVQGRLQTGSYTDKEGMKVYTTDVIADRVKFLEWGEKKEEQGFNELNEDVPF